MGIGVDDEDGIIPAYAGLTIIAHRREGLGRDHPRIRGVNVAGDVAPVSPVGSSPHTRG